MAASCSIGRWRCHPLAIHISIRMIRDVPATIDDKKNETGITGDHHWGASLSGISRNKDPRELWCIVDSVTAAIASMIGSAFFCRARNNQAITVKTSAASAAYAKFRESK